MNTRKSIFEKRSKKGTILIALMFLGVMSPKAWGYAQKELPPTSSEEIFSSSENVYLSRAILTDEKGVAICQVNLVENPEFLPEFAEAGSSDLRSLDLPECEEQNLDIVAQYADQAWIKRDVAIVPVALAATGIMIGGCVAGAITAVIVDPKEDNDHDLVLSSGIAGGVMGGLMSLPAAIPISGWLGAAVAGSGAFGVISGIACGSMFYE